MDGMPHYKDMVTVAQGKDLVKKLEGNKAVVFKETLANGAVLIGINFSPNTQHFPALIGTKNAALLPYPMVIQGDKATILDPRYYISVMYPLLQMSQFMKIAAVPNAIIKEAQNLFQ